MRLTRKRFDIAIQVAEEALTQLGFASNILHNYGHNEQLSNADRNYLGNKCAEYDKARTKLVAQLKEAK